MVFWISDLGFLFVCCCWVVCLAVLLCCILLSIWDIVFSVWCLRMGGLVDWFGGWLDCL